VLDRGVSQLPSDPSPYVLLRSNLIILVILLHLLVFMDSNLYSYLCVAFNNILVSIFLLFIWIYPDRLKNCVPCVCNLLFRVCNLLFLVCYSHRAKSTFLVVTCVLIDG
jgi:hypothetical protein